MYHISKINKNSWPAFGQIQLIENTIRAHFRALSAANPFLLAAYWIGNYWKIFIKPQLTAYN